MPRTQTITKELYQFDELDEQAKEKARDWFRSCLDENDMDCVVDDFIQITEIIGIDLATHQVQLMNGKTRSDPTIYWSGFCQQGSGACFEGTYTYRAEAVGEIRDYCSDEELLRIVDELTRIQTPRLFNRLPLYDAKIKHSGHYYHEHSTIIEVDTEDNDESYDTAIADTIAELMRDLMRWLYKQLEKQDEYVNSDEYIDENIEANEYEFTEEGEIA